MLVSSESREIIEMRQLAIVAHELRNPLSAAWCAVRMLGRASHGVAEIDHALPLIDQQLGYIARIVDDLVDVASVTSGKFTLQKKNVDLSDLLRGAVNACCQRVDIGGREFNLQVAKSPIQVNADPLRLMQVFANLLDNAVKYCSPCGRIGVTIERNRDEAVVTVEDDGVGISVDVLPRIFDMFMQGDTPTITSSRGLGVGLAVAKQVIEGHGGHIEARSAGVGAGSRFIVRLPLESMMRALIDELKD
ncbi:HAMP domain-containing histidine kinase [Lysobacter sp. S4-A87]|uniref:sensor histidine kinase n=1 Tax=Lysobacter sp. S4-A87 TaxID=2925843 RepID=UPI001F52EF53|nr:HAMP domain-containing sensor histidine kinase [Lysobacter sp. S4-A87]UNK49862.1 HAMP domain-containing histidine kinase [Lysobacter sp. S4-A87]